MITLELNSMRTQGDAFADALAATLIGGGVGSLNAALAKLSEGAMNPGDVPEALQEYVQSQGQLPPWANAEKIKRAQDLFTLHGPVFGVVLLFKSLPVLYCGGNGGAQVLSMTGRLSGHYRQRASETLRFILDVMKPGGLNPGGSGIRTALRVRFLHASIRYYANASPLWSDKPHWGQPINQEELAGTLLAFSSVTLEGVSALGLSISAADAEAYLHTWKVIGHILGIDQNLLPPDFKMAKKLWDEVARRNFFTTPEGVQLMRDHQAFLEGLIPGELLDGGVPVLIRYLMGSKLANVLQVPAASTPTALLFFLKEFFKLQRLGFLLFPRLTRKGRRISIKLMEGLQHYWDDGNSTPFSIPTGLKGAKT